MAARALAIGSAVFITIPKIKVSNMVLQSLSWCFTLNNYTNNDIVRLTSLGESTDVQYIIFGKEIGDSGTPHLQGYIKFSSRKRVNGVKRAVGECHVEIARNPTAAITYCKKDEDFTEIGEIQNNQGKRSDLDAVKEAVSNGEIDLKYFAENHSEVYARNKNFIVDYIQFNRPIKRLKTNPLYIWQAELWTKLKLTPDPRKIYFYVDPIGNTGKSWFARYYAEHHETAQVMLAGKGADMAFAYDEKTTTMFMDVPRTRIEFFPWDFLENIKNGTIFSGKYTSCMKRFDVPHIVVFMNESPDETKLSHDRYDIKHITREMCKVHTTDTVMETENEISIEDSNTI
jgi:hypothetical protein